MANSRLEDIRKVRLEKLEKLRSSGVNPYPSKYSRPVVTVKEARTRSGDNVSVSGRLRRVREHGNVIFADLRDATDAIQLLFQKKNLPETFPVVKLLDAGDIVGVSGQVITSKTGEITIDVSSFELLSKSIRPLPDDWYGLKDEEARYRQRYLDLLLNPDLVDLFRKKAVFWQSMRTFLIEHGFLEVETPVLESTAGGASATPFVTHHEALDTDLYLRISMGELWQKRLMVGGLEKTFEIGRQFRNEGISREHLQDYTQMEFYWAYANFEDSMRLVEEMYKHVAKTVFNTLEFTIGPHKVDLSHPWDRIDYSATIKDRTGFDISGAGNDAIIAKLKELKVVFQPSQDRGALLDALWKHVRKDISGPAFLVGHPVEVSPLAKRTAPGSAYVERYQVILAGSEVGNGYSELNDPVDQAQRFQEQQQFRDKGDAEAQMYDDDFVTALEYAMPPVSGFGVSERLFSFLADKPIRETVLFPLLRPESRVSPGKKPAPSESQSGDFAIAPDVTEKFPGISFAYTTITGVNITRTNPDLDEAKATVVAAARKHTPESLSELPPVKAYRRLFKETGVDYHSRRPSPEALLRRLVQGKDLYVVNTAVDAYNLAVIETAVGLGGFDADKISPPVQLRFAKEGEKMLLLGDHEATDVKPGELVYADSKKLLTLDLNYRDIDATKITEKTKNILLFSDGGPGISPEEIEQALLKGARYIQKYCGGEIGEVKIVR